MDGITLFWTWVAGLLTLCIFSFLYKDNPFYKFAEHLYVGVSAGYTIAQQYDEVLRKIMFANLSQAQVALTGPTHQILWDKWAYLLPGILGVMLILRLVPKIAWVSRWPLAFYVGMGTGYGIVLTMDAQILEQINATIVPLWKSGEFAATLRNWLILVGVLCGLVYFYFSKEHKGPVFGTASRVGIFFLMMTFGSAFGMTVMGRVSLLIGRVQFILFDWIGGSAQYFHIDWLTKIIHP